MLASETTTCYVPSSFMQDTCPNKKETGGFADLNIFFIDHTNKNKPHESIV
jgi:hypothetical protein